MKIIDVASGYKHKAAPWLNLAQNQNHYIDRRYIPEGFQFVAPKDISKADALQFVDFIIDRQRLWSETEVFQFRVVNKTRRADHQCDVTAAIYPGHQMYDEKAAEAGRKKASAKSQKAKSSNKTKKVAANVPIINELVVSNTSKFLSHDDIY